MSAAVWSEPPERPLMTLRVSRDSGRTWAPVREFWPDDVGLYPDTTSVWPPCTCHRHRTGSESR